MKRKLTTEDARAAFLAKPGKQVGWLTLRPASLGTLVLLEQTEHPFMGSNPNQENALSTANVCRAAFVMAHWDEASAALREGRTAFDKAAFRFAKGIEIGLLQQLAAAVLAVIMEAMPPRKNDYPRPKMKAGETETSEGTREALTISGRGTSDQASGVFSTGAHC